MFSEFIFFITSECDDTPAVIDMVAPLIELSRKVWKRENSLHSFRSETVKAREVAILSYPVVAEQFVKLLETGISSHDCQMKAELNLMPTYITENINPFLVLALDLPVALPLSSFLRLGIGVAESKKNRPRSSIRSVALCAEQRQGPAQISD